MNRLTFFKRLFHGAAAATIAPKVEAKAKETKPVFFLRGNDLYLPLQRSNHQLNLRRP